MTVIYMGMIVKESNAGRALDLAGGWLCTIPLVYEQMNASDTNNDSAGL